MNLVKMNLPSLMPNHIVSKLKKKVKTLFFQIIFMMEDSNSLDPLCIILVKQGAHGGKLLFRYPFNSHPSHPTSPNNNIIRDNP